ncbi:uroporphyrinogen-III synthase [Psychrobacter sp. YP14]|uniref:uroporphyrinogen-III synthase n=1 Tax=Psychrobacter sp. YP14 TaxID=2203895 RepID=UPI000D7D4127|nr:uroporphyrinogen-III synthase [Psychrobacter sp. YP14]AWT49964.1 uroporphyrinogen-III synthase [Psychrobacter sp. YP14]
MIFINTRPIERAQPLTQAMQDKGLTVLELPLLELTAIEIGQREQQYQQHFYQQPDQYQALVVVSPTAARMGLAACPVGFVPRCAVIAVGHATAEVLRVAGWQVHCPVEYSNEGMMLMPQLNRLGVGNRILVWRGRGGRRVLVNFLQENGVGVDAIAWYQRQCPPQAEHDFKQLLPQLGLSEVARLPDAINLNGLNSLHISPLDNPDANSKHKPLVLISSGEAFTNWRLLMASIDEISDKTVPNYQLNDFNYLTFGKRLTDTLNQLQLNCVRIENLDTSEVWRGVSALYSNLS